jgi:activating signal cointegrator 1
MKALTLTQPWATLVAIGAKKIETRSWSTGYRGILAIHAAKGFPKEAQEEGYREPFATVLTEAGIIKPSDLPLGQIVAVCRLVDCIPMSSMGAVDGSGRSFKRIRQHVAAIYGENEVTFGNYAPDRFAWVLEDMIKLPDPIPMKGSLGLWEVDPSVRKEIALQMQQVLYPDLEGPGVTHIEVSDIEKGV